MSISTIKDQDGKQYIIFDESELYDDNEMGDKLEDFEIQQILGKGSYGFVAKVRSTRNNKIYAMKQIDLSKVGSQKEIELCKREVEVLQRLNHVNINKYYKSFNKNNCLYIIMEFMDNGDLSGFIKAHEKFNKPVREVEVWNILLQSMTALAYIHSQNVIHRDIKPGNLFMTNDKTIKIGDFGVAAKKGNMTNVANPQFTGTVVGSPMFMSPEMIREEEYDMNTDIYSMGIAMYELCFFQSPKKAGINMQGQVVFKDVPLTKNQNIYSNRLLNILQSMIVEDKSKRKSSAELCQIIRNEYTQTFLKTSSLSAVTRCLYSLARFPKFIFEKYKVNKDTQPITYGFLEAIKLIMNNVHNQFNQFKEVLAIHNPKLNSDNEIDPVYIVAFLLEKMHKESNKVKQTNIDDEYVINSVFNGMDEDKSNKNEMFEKFFKYFSNNFDSIISNHFFGILKEKKTCQKCNMINYNFGCYCLLTFDLNELCPMNNMNNMNQVNLYNCFQFMHDRKKQYNLQDQVYCDRCLSNQVHIKTKQIYSMPYELIISLERGVNCANKTQVNFPFDLNLTNLVELSGSPSYYRLVGTVNSIEIGGEQHYISFTKLRDGEMWMCSDDDKINNTNREMALTYGIPILLFYSFVRQNQNC